MTSNSPHRDQVLHLFRENWTIGYVAELVGISRCTVKDIIKKEGLKRE